MLVFCVWAAGLDVYAWVRMFQRINQLISDQPTNAATSHRRRRCLEFRTRSTTSSRVKMKPHVRRKRVPRARDDAANANARIEQVVMSALRIGHTRDTNSRTMPQRR
jgi:hypothetical protein